MNKPEFSIGEEVEICLGSEPFRVTEILEVIPDLGRFVYRVRFNNQLSDYYAADELQHRAIQVAV